MAKRGRKPVCPYCRSANTTSKGTRRTVTLGDRPLRFCRACKRKFTVRQRGQKLQQAARMATEQSG